MYLCTYKASYRCKINKYEKKKEQAFHSESKFSTQSMKYINKEGLLMQWYSTKNNTPTFEASGCFSQHLFHKIRMTY